jgi:hypothetical protein
MPVRARLGMTLEPLLGLHCSISHRRDNHQEAVMFLRRLPADLTKISEGSVDVGAIDLALEPLVWQMIPLTGPPQESRTGLPQAKMLFLQSFLRKGVSFGCVRRNYNLQVL